MIYIARDGAQQGPYPIEQINTMLASGQLASTDLAWWEGGADWVPVVKAPGVVVAAPAPAAAPVQAAAPSVYAPPQGTIAPGGSFSAQVSPGTVQALRETRPWVLMLAILGIIGTAFMLLAGLMALVLGGTASAAAASSSGLPGGASTGLIFGMGLAYLVFAVLYLYPIIKLFKFSGAISRLNRSGSVRDLEDALGQQKSFWKFIGIVTLVVIVVYLIVGVVVGIGAVSAASSMRSTSPVPSPSVP